MRLFFPPIFFISSFIILFISTSVYSRPSCSSWKGVINVYDYYCQTTACQLCNSKPTEGAYNDCVTRQFICNVKNSPSVTTTTTKRTTQKPVPPPSNNGKAFKVSYLSGDYGTIPDAIRRMADNGYTHAILAFWVKKHAPTSTVDSYWDASGAWMNLSDSEKDDLLNYAHQRGMKILLSAGGATEATWEAMNSSGEVYGRMAGERTVKAKLDGLDIDLEGFPSGMGGNIIPWLKDVFKAARKAIGKDRLLTSAPQAPYFGQWGGNGYNRLAKETDVDFFFIQYYNQGTCSYNTYENIFKSASCWAGGSAVKEIVNSGIPAEKIVVGKYVPEKGSGGYVEPSDLADYVCRARNEGMNVAGWGCWVYQASSVFDPWLSAAKNAKC